MNSVTQFRQINLLDDKYWNKLPKRALSRSTKLRRNLNRLLWVYGVQCLCYLLLSSFLVVSLRRKTVLSTLLDNLGDSGFWTVSPGLQIRAWNLPDIHRSLPFSCRRKTRISDLKLLNILHCLSFFKYCWHWTFPYKLQYGL